jgi:gentisate 1,2-dioxygenase
MTDSPKQEFMTSETNMPDAQARKGLMSELARLNCRVAQPGDPPLFTQYPQSPMQPCHWRAADLARAFERIGKELTLEAGGPRRTVRLCNPGLPYGTTPTFWASIQVILPGEVATAHRHAASALRFIMQGAGAETTVDGERYEFNEGDLVLTPAWSWHDHEHKGAEPMIWLDVLDISLVRSMHATFFDASEVPRRPLAPIPDYSYRAFGSGIMRPPGASHDGLASPLLVYEGTKAKAALAQASKLEPDPFDDVVLEYQNPLTGAPALPTLGTMLQMLRPGTHTRAHQHTGSVVYYVIDGAGITIVDGRRLEWGKGDLMSLPPWAVHEHVNASPSNDALLFQVNDHPALCKLGLYRERAL